MATKHQTLMNLKNQLMFTWGSPVIAAGWFVGFFVIARLFPPLSPDLPIEQVKAYYLRDPNALYTGLCIMMMVVPLIALFSAAISEQLKRIEGPHSMMANGQLVLGALMVVFFIFPAFSLGIAAFRPERSAEAIQALSDSAWLPFVSAFQTTFWQWMVIAITILRDREQSVFPRWLGHFNLWMALSLLLAGLTFFTKTGFFAWDGVVALGVVSVTFQSWFLVMFWMVRKNILKQMAETNAAG